MTYLACDLLAREGGRARAQRLFYAGVRFLFFFAVAFFSLGILRHLNSKTSMIFMSIFTTVHWVADFRKTSLYGLEVTEKSDDV